MIVRSTCVLAAAVSLAGQVPGLQNARPETAAGVTIGAAIAGAGTATEPAWVAWRIPMVPGDRDLCSTWSNGPTTVRGAALEDVPEGIVPTFERPPAGPVKLEAGTALLVWLRVIDRQVDRLRLLTDDCSTDAGGRRVVWLPSVHPAASVAFLDTLMPADGSSPESGRRLATSAIMAIALHADDSADVALDRRMESANRELRAAAVTWTARARGRRGFERIASLLSSVTEPAFRRSLTVALGETREPDTLARLRALALSDADAHVRGDAFFAYARLVPAADAPSVEALLGKDTSEEVRRRGVRGLARRPTGATDLLLKLARTSPDRVVRTEAVRALSQSSEPAARDYLRELLAK